MEDFDWEFYVNKYEDLRNAGINNRISAYNHWIQYGKEEGRFSRVIRKTNDVFDWKFYINNYADLRCCWY